MVLNARQVFVHCNAVATELACYDVELPSGEQDASVATVQNAARSIPSSFASFNTTSFNSNNKQRLPISVIGTRGTGDTFRLLNVQEWQQPDFSNRCWAATAWCIGEYKNKNNPNFRPYASPEELAQYLGVPNKTYKNVVEMCEYIRRAYGVGIYQLDPNKHTILNETEIEEQIDMDNPFGMVWKQTNGGEYSHMTTGCGYCKGDFEVAVMDSLEGQILWVLKAPSSQYYEMQMGRLTYYWMDTAIIKR